jgi:hypothetical protein
VSDESTFTVEFTSGTMTFVFEVSALTQANAIEAVRIHADDQGIIVESAITATKTLLH